MLICRMLLKLYCNHKSCFKIFSVSGTDLLASMNSTVDEDIVAALGSYSFNFARHPEIKALVTQGNRV